MYTTPINFIAYGALPGSEQKVSFDVYGTNQDNTPAQNLAPHGVHTVRIAK